MKKAPLYSRSRQRAGAPMPTTDTAAAARPSTATPSPTTSEPAAPAPLAQRPSRWGAFVARHRMLVASCAAVALLLAGGVAGRALIAPPIQLTQKDIDAAVRHSLEKEPLPSAYAKAHAAVRPSVVRVVGLDDENEEPPKPGDDPRQHTRSTGTGVVIVDNGTILTNLHVVVGSKRIKVTFADGHESDASMVGAQPENDLAVLRAKSIPDDLVAATMRGTGDLMPGDEVIAIGFPFGIGPSTSAGVISGLKRSFRAPEGERLTNLIQFDAAANPGNSGGPLITMDGAVVGIVTAILNPGEQGTFIGIGFAVPIENAAAAVGLPPF
ncbi:trypsin-like peptidase domain-containing protein [Piscinibacter sp. XHJ-5]|uniref:S1C family serine protease n=1 Tax=Piscinibacter sp. XHJ-5 TaxID=3037797 RepID=UPI0024536F61|nr:trypsin-like peptidase domain-containing protein [Piscinibacter sp. XHJ-5]